MEEAQDAGQRDLLLAVNQFLQRLPDGIANKAASYESKCRTAL